MMRAVSGVDCNPARGIGASTEVGAVTERRQPGVADEHVQAHRQEREDQDTGERQQRVGRQPERGDGQSSQKNGCPG